MLFRSEDDFDQELLDSFPLGVRKIAPEAAAKTVAEAAGKLEAAMRSKDLFALFSLMDLEGDAGAASRGCARAAKSWWQIHNPDAPRLAVPLGFQEDGKSAVVSMQFFSPREPARNDFRSFYFEKSENGWLLMPGIQPTNSPTDSQLKLARWVEDRSRTVWLTEWQNRILSGTQRLASIATGNAPSTKDAEKVITNWLAAMRTADIESALELTVSLDLEGGTARSLRNLGLELSSAVRGNGVASITSIEQGATWTAVAVKSQSISAVAFPLYLVVATPGGPRLLLETDLFIDPSSGHEMLNKEALRRVKQFATPEANEELLELFEKFRQNIVR